MAWVVLPMMWSGLVIWKFVLWRRGDVSYESFITTAGTVAMIMVFSAVIPLIEAWRARQPKPPPVYRSTILD